MATEYTLAAVSNKVSDFVFTSDGKEVTLKEYYVKLDGFGDKAFQLLRNPSTTPPQQGDKLTGDIIKAKRKQANGEWVEVERLKVKSERNIGRTGETRRDNPREIRANMAVKTAYEQMAREFSGLDQSQRNREAFEKAVTEDARLLFKLATELAESD